MIYYSALHYAAKAKKSEEKAAEYLQQVGNKVTTVEGIIGDIGFAPLGIDEAQNKRRYLNGQVISQSQFVSFANKIKSAIKLYPNIATTETNWQAEVTNSVLGQCGKFVIDDALGTIRLPKVVNINGLQDLSLLGGIKAESLPNITGTVKIISGDRGDATGAFRKTSRVNKANTAAGGEYWEEVILGVNASRSSSTYQDNAPVQQEAVQYPYYIQVSTGVEETVDVTREIELNNPFSLLDYKWSEYEITNASWLISNGTFHSGTVYKAVYELLLKLHNGTETKEGVSVKLSTEAYSDTDFVINTADTTFRLPIKVKLASGNAVVGNGITLGWTNGTQTGGMRLSGTTNQATIESNLYGTQVGTANTTANAITRDVSVGITTDPEYSGIETSSSGLYLYFYVGETIQDANVIAASNALTEIADLKGNVVNKNSVSDRETVVGWGMPDFDAGVSIELNVDIVAPYPCFVTAEAKGNTGRLSAISLSAKDINNTYRPVGVSYSIVSGYNSSAVVSGFFAKGQTFKCGKSSGDSYSAVLYPLKGVN